MKKLLAIIPLAVVLLFSACRNNDDEGSSANTDLELSFEPIAEKPEIGQAVTFQLNLYNRGPLAAEGVAIENKVPAGYSQVSNINAGGTFTEDIRIIRWSGISIQPEETLTFSFTATAEQPTEGLGFTQAAQVAANNQGDPDSTAGNLSGDPSEDDEAALALFPRAGELTLNFRALYEQVPLIMFERTYPYEDNMALKMQLFQFYLSNVRLLKGEEEVPATEIDLISFGDVYTEAAAMEGKSSSLAFVPPGTYTGIAFGIGLTPELNATIPPDYPLGHPLSENYWEAASSYIFFKFEGNADLEPNGEFSDKLTFHVGGNGNFRELAFDEPITIADEQSLMLQFTIDLQKILVDQNTGAYLDFRQVMQSHTNESPSATFMADHLKDAFEMK